MLKGLFQNTFGSGSFLHTSFYNVFNKKEEPKPIIYDIKNRGVKFTEDDLKVLKPLMFSEISNREPDKQKLEFNTILNTAINRMGEYKKVKGRDYSLSEVLQMSNQYQGYEPNGRKEKGGKVIESQYQIWGRNDLVGTSSKKREYINSLVDSIGNNDIIDNTQGAFFYQHNPDQTITYDNNKKLFK